jgi:tRNA A37 threonylcarbamoyladenosine biosynthesis protein TsaE
METQQIFNPIGYLNEYCQKTKTAFPVYNITNQEGPPHSPTFTIECLFKEKEFIGHGLSIKEAKENVSFKVIDELKLKDIEHKMSSFKIVEYSDNLESLWNGTSSNIKIKFRKKENNSQQFKTFIFSKIEEEEIEEEV